jgi:uncharacterized damage-inducible protein DinB
MKIVNAIARQLLEVHFGENWTEVWIRKTLEDVSPDEARQHTAASANTIASLLYHIAFYNKVILARLQGVEPFIGAANGFDGPVPQDQADWESLKADNLESAERLAEAIRKIPDEVLEEPMLKDGASSSYFRQLHGVIEHAHYHLGQIVILKNLIRNKSTS